MKVTFAELAELTAAAIAEAAEALETLGLGDGAQFKADIEALFGNEI